MAALHRPKRWRNPLFVLLGFLFVCYSLPFFQPACQNPNSFHNSRRLFSFEELPDDKNDTEKLPPQFPDDLFTLGQRKHGAIVLHTLGLVYMFVALAIVCDEFFVPALEVITEKLKIPEDVAGATFMAAGGSAPELFTSVIGVFISYDDVGIGTIVGSAVFNILFVISMCAVFSRSVLQLTWWPLFRDVTFYSLSLIVLIVCFKDNTIFWYEALVLLICYACYVIFMGFNETVEKAVKNLLNKKKCTKIGSTDQLVTLPSARKRVATPTLHAGTKFRQGLLQLMIHSIDPMYEGKLDDANPQLQTIANVRILLDTVQPADGVHTFSRQSTKQEDNYCVDKSIQTDMSELSVFTLTDGSHRARLQPLPLKTESKSEVYINPTIGNGISNISSTVEDTIGVKKCTRKQVEEVLPPEEEIPQPLDLSWPGTTKKRISYVLLAPIIFPLWITMPDVRRQGKKKWFVVSFLGSILWIAIFSYLMVWWASLIGEVIGIPNEVMGLVFLAAGTSIPDLITSVLVARKGFGDMAVSSSIGSNLFDITVGLPLPWLLSALVHGPVHVSSTGMICSVVLLFLMLLFVIISIAAFKWKLNIGLAVVMFLLYFVFVAISLLLQYKIISCVKIIKSITG